MKTLMLKNGFMICFMVLLFSACTTSVIMRDNPQFAKPASKQFATVYVMRPAQVRTRGIADNDLTVEFGEHQLAVLLSAGEYVAFKVRPGAMDIITRNETYLTGKPDPVSVWRARNFTFEAGKTYFIEAKLIQEEFRGIYFVAQEVDLKTAKSYIKSMKPAGDLAKARPISAL
ncbi:MAG TPA: hypothetical protein ENK06_13385 [Gammaproteobacteria bacterium]|nr:hypothetical protein [Gammaproteobacteria bacterium]